MDQPKPLAFKSGLKYRSSNPLENLISLLNFEMQTTSKIRNIVAFSDFISTIEPKNVKQALKDVDWVELMQYKLHQFERSNVWCLFPRPWNRTIYEPGVYSGIILKKMELSQRISPDWFSKAIIKRKTSTMMRYLPPLLEWRLSKSL